MAVVGLIDSLKGFFKKNARHFKIKTVFLYGSQAWGLARNDSDIDIAIVFLHEPENEDDIFNAITDISFLLSDKLHCEVNILPLYPDFRYPMVYYNAIVSGIPLYISKFEEYVDLKNEAVFQMEDYSLFGRSWQIRIMKQNMEAFTHA